MFLRVRQEDNPLASKTLGNELIYIKCQMFLQILSRLQSNNIAHIPTNIERSVLAKKLLQCDILWAWIDGIYVLQRP